MTDEKSDAKATTKSKPKLGQPSASEDSASPYPNMELCQQIHKLSVKSVGTEDGKLQAEVLNRIRDELENPTLYESVESRLGVTTGIWSVADIAAQKEANEKTVKDLEQKVEDAKESAGDMEVMDARVEIARFAAKSLTEKEALEAYKNLLELPKVSSGKKIDAVMESSRLSSFYGDAKKASESIDSVSNMIDTCLSFEVSNTMCTLTSRYAVTDYYFVPNSNVFFSILSKGPKNSHRGGWWRLGSSQPTQSLPWPSETSGT